MDFEVTTYGGGKVLWEIFNVLAMIFHSNAKFVTAMWQPVALISVIWVFSRSLQSFNIGIFAKEWFLPVFALTAVLLVPSTTVHIIDRVDSEQRYAAVDHVPVGVAAMAAGASQISDALTQLIDDAMAPEDSMRLSTTGSMFGARLVSAARDAQIKDPIVRQNVKEFVGQCFMWPFVFTNIAPGKEAALNSTDILGFVETTPHSWLGGYWRERDGNTSFKYCREAVPLVRAAMSIESQKAVSDLGVKLFGAIGSNSREIIMEESAERANARLLRYFPTAWQHMASSAATAFEIVNQEMMINAYREGLDDKRELYSNGRINPELLAYSAARGGAQQNTAFLVKGLLAGRYLPTIQSVFVGLILCSFIIIAAIAFFPGGFKVVGLWAKLCIWVYSWPIFQAILNGIGHMYARESMAAELGSAGGLALLTQTGLSDAAFDAYCWISGLQLSIPVISWAVISQGGYAITQVASSITGNLESFAQRTGTELTDNTIGFDNQTMHTRSIANMQLAQQQLGSGFNTSDSINDGRSIMTYGDGGAVIGQQMLSSLAMNIAANDNLSTMASNQFQESSQLAAQNMVAFSDRLSKGYGISSGFNTQEANDIRQTAEDFKRQAQDFSKQHNITEQTAAELALRGSVGVKWSSGDMLAGKAFSLASGVSANAEISGSGSISTNATKLDSLQKALNSSEGKSFMENASKLQSFSQTHGTNITDSSTKDIAESLNRSVLQTQNWSHIASHSETSSLASATNLNDRALDALAAERFGGSKEQAFAWASTHQESYESYAAGYMNDHYDQLKDRVNQADHVLGENEIKSYLDQANFQDAADLNQSAFEMQFDQATGRLQNDTSSINKQLGDLKLDFETQQHKLDEEHREKASTHNIKRAWNKI